MACSMHKIVLGWTVCCLVALGLGGAEKLAEAQGLGLPGVGVGAPMMRPPQRAAPQGGAGGAPGQMNQRMGGTARPGQPVNRSSPSNGFTAMLPQRSAAHANINRGGNMVKSGAGMATGTKMSGAMVPGLGNVGRGR